MAPGPSLRRGRAIGRLHEHRFPRALGMLPRSPHTPRPMMNPRLSLMSVLLALPLAAQNAAVGDKVPDCKFPTFLNGDGRQSLSEFFGQPVMIDVWGTH